MTDKQKRIRAMDALYKAVQRYVEANGGNLSVIGGVEVQQWPEDFAYNFRVAIRCTGKKPELTR
jgi:hypothetical protein